MGATSVFDTPGVMTRTDSANSTGEHSNPTKTTIEPIDGSETTCRTPFRSDRRGLNDSRLASELLSVQGIDIGLAKSVVFSGEAAIMRPEYDRSPRPLVCRSNIYDSYPRILFSIGGIQRGKYGSAVTTPVKMGSRK